MKNVDLTSSAAPSLSRAQRRNLAIAQRDRQSKTDIAAWNQSLQNHLLQCWPKPPGRIIGFCWPIKNEPDVFEVIAQWARQMPLVAALPVVNGPNLPLAFRPWYPGAAMVTDRYGIPTPAEGDFVSPDVLLIPLNVFDAAGYRIGYGGGFFDRTLATLQPRPLAIGIGFEIGRVPDIFPEAHDQPLDWIVTEAGATKIPNP